MAKPDLYSILGVERSAADADIRKAYRRLARKLHPDVNPNNPSAESRFKDASYAYEVLGDPEKRRTYDEFGEEGLMPGFDPERARQHAQWRDPRQGSPFADSFGGGDINLEDLLSGVFGGGGRGRGPSKGSDQSGEVSIDFMDAVRGSEVRVELAGRTLRVKIPPGTEDSAQIRLAGQGETSRSGGPQGDLYLTVRVRPHRFFSREGNDLHLELPVTLSEAVAGASIEVPTPNGNVTLKVPARSRSGQKLRLRGKGVPSREGGRGDLYVALRVEVPDSRDPKLVELARELDAFYGSTDLRKPLREST